MKMGFGWYIKNKPLPAAEQTGIANEQKVVPSILS